MEEAAYYEEADGIGYVRAEGHMTALLCPSIKAKVLSGLEQSRRIDHVAFDLSRCEYMDSTFLGLIVGIAKRLAAQKSSKPILYGANPACLGLLRTIGVLGMVELAEGSGPPLEAMARIEGGPKAGARFVLEAHEELSAISEENRGRFAALLAALRKALGERP